MDPYEAALTLQAIEEAAAIADAEDTELALINAELEALDAEENDE